jgi:hypothetical protein
MDLNETIMLNSLMIIYFSGIANWRRLMAGLSVLGVQTDQRMI